MSVDARLIRSVEEVATALQSKGYHINHFLALGERGTSKLLYKLPEGVGVQAINHGPNDSEPKAVSVEYAVLSQPDCHASRIQGVSATEELVEELG